MSACTENTGVCTVKRGLVLDSSVVFGKRPKVDRSKKSGGFQLSGQGFGLPVGQPFGRG